MGTLVCVLFCLVSTGGAIELALTGDNASSSEVSLNATASTTAG